MKVSERLYDILLLSFKTTKRTPTVSVLSLVVEFIVFPDDDAQDLIVVVEKN